ncbi:unnamed protein product [Paramecium pentaurelia]|uniref:CMP/dCMP-type deaminase domain-containing protein n=1 Tax=Paramecium pentaurelia TaxID=43138 RepID=A0A8S1Y4P3_9CILI|nr:unnamed protein product [Paramecium pentaurelia]
MHLQKCNRFQIKKQQEINVSFIIKIILLQLKQKMKHISIMQDILQQRQRRNLLNIIKMKNHQKPFHNCNYYEKDLILVIYFEPCIMCVMSLVHSRIKDVYFYQKRVIEEGVNDQLQLNNMKQLNHKYLVLYQN